MKIQGEKPWQGASRPCRLRADIVGKVQDSLHASHIDLKIDARLTGLSVAAGNLHRSILMIWRTLTGHMILDQTCSIKDTVEIGPMALRIYESTWVCSPKVIQSILLR